MSSSSDPPTFPDDSLFHHCYNPFDVDGDVSFVFHLLVIRTCKFFSIVFEFLGFSCWVV